MDPPDFLKIHSVYLFYMNMILYFSQNVIHEKCSQNIVTKLDESKSQEDKYGQDIKR